MEKRNLNHEKKFGADISKGNFETEDEKSERLDNGLMSEDEVQK